MKGEVFSLHSSSRFGSRLPIKLPNKPSLFKSSRKPINLGILLVNRQDKLKVGFGYQTSGIATPPIVQAPTFVWGLRMVVG